MTEESSNTNIAMSSIPFERYDEEFQTLTEQVKESLERDLSSDNLQYSYNLINQCDDLLKQMSVEARGSSDSSVKKELLHKVRICKTTLSNLKDDHKKLTSDYDRQQLLMGNATTDSTSGGNNQHKDRLLKTEESLQNQNNTLDNAKRIMAETEDVALEITSELGRNRETLESAHGRVYEVSGLTNRARRILQSMNRRQTQQKLALYGGAAIIVIVFLIIIFNL